MHAFQRDKTGLLCHAASTQRIIDRPMLHPCAGFNSRLFLSVSISAETLRQIIKD